VGVQRQSQEGVRRIALGRLSWQIAQRDDQRVAEAVHQGEELDAIYNLDEAGLLDEFYHFLETIGFVGLIGELKLPGVERVMIPVVQFVLLYLLKTLYGIESMNALPMLLFSNVALMSLIGFNAHQVANGLTNRGDDRRERKPKQGPLSAQCLAQNICKFTVDQMEGFFNGVVCLIVKMGLLRGELTVALDGSKLPTTKNYQGRGCLKVEREVKDKKTGQSVKQVRFVFGWKVLVLIEVRTRLPLAAKVVKIEAYEGRWLVPLLQQAQANLGEWARIVKVVVDRGYLDGEDLWQVNLMDLIFVIMAKDKMIVREDAQALARGGEVHERVEEVRHGRGRKAWIEQIRTRLVGIEALTTYDDYGSEEHSRERNRKDFAGNPINAVVVRTWKNQEYGDKGHVLLTNGPVADPFVALDDYDWRSVIENGIFKEGKHPWNLRHFPQKTEAGVVVHCLFTLAVMALTTAFRLWQAQEAREQEPEADTESESHSQTESQPLEITLLGGEGTERWRRRLKAQNRDKVIVFVGEHYGIFHVAELAVLGGLRLKSLPKELGSPQAILARYGLSP
jgi:hypothetical protein